MGVEKVRLGPAHHRNVWLRFGIYKGERLFFPHQKTGGQSVPEQVIEPRGNDAMPGDLDIFSIIDAANQLRAAAIIVELIESMVLSDRERRNPLANFRYFKNCRHCRKTLLFSGRSVEPGHYG